MSLRILVFITSVIAFTGLAQGKSNINGYLGYGPGGLGFGVDYEMKWDKHTNWGAYLHNYSASDEAIGGMAIGGFFRPVFKKGPYQYRLTIGAGAFQIEAPLDEDSTTAMGPLLGLGITKKITKEVNLGFETYSYYGWFSEPTGKIFDAAMFVAAYKL